MATYPVDVPVVIVGAGPTGLTCANLLRAYGVEFVVLDRAPAPLELPRAIVLDDEGARTVQSFGLHNSYLKQTLAGEGSRYFDDNGTCFAETGAGPTNYGFAKRQYILQPELEKALRDAFSEHRPGLLHYDSEVTNIAQGVDSAVVQVRRADGSTHQISTNWVLACDGGRSPIRESLKIAMSGGTYQQDWVVIDTIDDPDRSLFSKFFCSNHRPAVSVPAPNGGRRYEFMLRDREERERILAPEMLSELLRPHREYDESKILRKTIYTFHARLAERFRDSRILLLGDAAHLTPPFAGQGMNAGLRDAHNVAWKIAAIENGNASPAILDSYETERRKPAWDMIQLAVAMGNFVMPMTAKDLEFRESLMEQLAPFPALRDYLIQMKFKPKPRHIDGLYLDLDCQPYEASLVGEMIPQPTIETVERKCLLDDLLGPGFALLAQDSAGLRALETIKDESIWGLPLRKVAVPALPSANPGENRAVDHVKARPLRTHRDQILLIRPDRYCAAAFAPDALVGELARYDHKLKS